MPLPTSQFPTTLQPDAPLVQDDQYRASPLDRALVDNQIRGLQKVAAATVVNGVLCTYVTVDGGSPAIQAGDNVCLASSALGTVAKATASPVAAAGSVYGMAMLAAPPLAKLLVALRGLIPPSVTGLAASAGAVTLNTTTARCAVAAGTYALGTVDAAGFLNFNPGAGGGGGGSLVIQNNGTPMPSEPALNIIGATINDNAGVSTDVTIVATPAGSDQEVQFNNGGVFGTDPNQYFQYDHSAHRLYLRNVLASGDSTTSVALCTLVLKAVDENFVNNFSCIEVWPSGGAHGSSLHMRFRGAGFIETCTQIVGSASPASPYTVHGYISIALSGNHTETAAESMYRRRIYTGTLGAVATITLPQASGAHAYYEATFYNQSGNALTFTTGTGGTIVIANNKQAVLGVSVGVTRVTPDLDPTI